MAGAVEETILGVNVKVNKVFGHEEILLITLSLSSLGRGDGRRVFPIIAHPLGGVKRPNICFFPGQPGRLRRVLQARITEEEALIPLQEDVPGE